MFYGAQGWPMMPPYAFMQPQQFAQEPQASNTPTESARVQVPLTKLQQHVQQQHSASHRARNPNCMLNEVAVAEAVGGGELLVLKGKISHNGRLITARVWLDTGATITLISRKLLEENLMNCTKSVSSFVIQGINNSS